MRRLTSRMMIEVPVVVRADREAGGWVVGSPELGVFAGGPTTEEAMKAATEALQLFFEICYARNILDDTLNGCGFELRPHAGDLEPPPSDPPRLSDDDLVRQVPVELLFNNTRRSEGVGSCQP